MSGRLCSFSRKNGEHVSTFWVKPLNFSICCCKIWDHGRSNYCCVLILPVVFAHIRAPSLMDTSPNKVCRHRCTIRGPNFCGWKFTTSVPGSINSHYFHIIGDGKLNPIVGVYIPIIRIPYSRLDDHPQYKEFRP